MIKKNILTLLISITMLVVLSVSIMAIEYQEAPILKKKVAQGELPPVEKRLPAEPVVIEPNDEIGKYGGTMVTGFYPNVEHILMLNKSGTETIPNIAKDWKFNEDGTEFTLYLREGLRWSDGVESTAEDFMFWYNDVLQNEELTPNIPSYMQVDGNLIQMEKVNDYEVKFIFSKPNFGFINQLNSTGFNGRLGDFMLPAHALKKYHIKYNENANKLAQEKGFDHWWQLFDVYTSFVDQHSILSDLAGIPDFRAWTLKAETPSGVIYERNPYYFKVDTEGNQLPYIDKVIWHLRDVKDSETRLMAAISGDIDFFAWGTSLKDFPLIKKNEEKGNYRSWAAKELRGSISAYFINQTYEEDPVMGDLLRNLKFRQALSYAIDRDEINEVICLGQGVPRQATFHPTVAGYKEEWGKAYAQFDLKKANQLLDEIGLDKRSEAGWRLRPDGEELTLIVPISDDKPTRLAISEIIVDHWQEAGIKAKLKVMARSNLMTFTKANLHHIFVWGLDSVSGFSVIGKKGGFLNPEFWLAPYGVVWKQWFSSGGTEGQEPPNIIKEVNNWANSLPYVSPEKQKEYIQKIGDTHMNNLWIIGTVGMTGKPVIVNKYLGNVREESFGDNPDVGGLRNFWQEQFFWTTPDKRGE